MVEFLIRVVPKNVFYFYNYKSNTTIHPGIKTHNAKHIHDIIPPLQFSLTLFFFVTLLSKTAMYYLNTVKLYLLQKKMYENKKMSCELGEKVAHWHHSVNVQCHSKHSRRRSLLVYTFRVGWKPKGVEMQLEGGIKVFIPG